MNTSMNRHPFALPAFVLSVLITSTMALLPAAAGIGADHAVRNGQTLQAATAQSQSLRVTG
ncbi:MAG: hypothetical protein WCD08_00425 [Steroidobacteraceae bacterium]